MDTLDVLKKVAAAKEGTFSSEKEKEEDLDKNCKNAALKAKKE